MTTPTPTTPAAPARRLSQDDLGRLMERLREDGYRVIGPTVRDGAIVYDELSALKDLPLGVTDEQAPGRYRLKARGDRAAFGYVVGPHSWKRQLLPPREPLVQIRLRAGEPPEWTQAAAEGEKLALLGVRGCELAGISVLDRVLLGGPYVDPRYRARRELCFVVAVSCTEAGELCFCASMQTGPRAEGDYDLRLTELGEELLAEAGSERGRALLDQLAPAPASPELARACEEAVARCATSMGRTLDTEDLPARLMGNLDHPRWQAIAERCLSCGNCTSVCPTCFCVDVTDTSGLDGAQAGRERSWDSCFHAAHGAIAGAQFRPDTSSRYRQWMTHKLATWTSQFGQSGCVGCGRCIAWCPVGIDLPAEAAAIARGTGAPRPLPAPRSYARSAKADAHGEDGQLPVAAQVLDVVQETADVVTLTLQAPAGYVHAHGQFNMLSLPGVGDVPISIAGFHAGRLEHTLRAVGAATRALCALRPSDVLGMRGPFGSSWPLDRAVGRPLVVIAGGIGLAPLRSVLREVATRPAEFPNTRLLYGARSPDDILYDRELLGMTQSRPLRAHVTVDHGGPDWTGNVGVVTALMRRKTLPREALYFVCGPELMMHYALDELLVHGVGSDQIYLSMERNMKCAAGFCGRCQYGPHFVCKDGPVFRHDHVAEWFGKPGF